MQRTTRRQALGLGAAMATIAFGGAYLVGAAAEGNATPLESPEHSPGVPDHHLGGLAAGTPA